MLDVALPHLSKGSQNLIFITSGCTWIEKKNGIVSLEFLKDEVCVSHIAVLLVSEFILYLL